MKFSKFKFLAMAMSCMVIAFCSSAYSADSKTEDKESNSVPAFSTTHLTSEEASINDTLVSEDTVKPAVKATYMESVYSAGGAVASSLYQLLNFSVNNPGKAFTIALAASIPATAATTNLQGAAMCSLWNQNNCDKCACYCSTYELREGMGLNGVPYDASPHLGNIYNWFKVESIGNFSGSGACETACSERKNIIKGCYEFQECTTFKNSDEFKDLVAKMNSEKKVIAESKNALESD